MPIKEGNKVKVHYTGTLDDGTVFDDSAKHGQPLEFEVGKHQVIKGFEDAVIGMEKDEEEDITLQPTEAYGEYKEELKKAFPKDKFPQDKEIKPDMMLMLTLPNGAQMPAKIIEVKEKDVVLDINHPLAGKTLKFKLKIVEIN